MSGTATVRDRLVSRLAVLRQTHGDEIKQLERMRKEFIREYSPRQIACLPIEKYAIGRGERTFCYRVERELDGLGRILGAPAYKFGVFFSKSKNAYEYTGIWGTSAAGAYEHLREAILQLLRDAAVDDIDALIASRISPMLKGKILHLFYPEQFAPIYSPDHLKHFVARLNLVTTAETSVQRQRALMDYRRSEPLLKNEPPALMMRFLYDEYPPNGTYSDEDEPASPPVSIPKALAGLVLLEVPPEGPDPSKSAPPPKPGKFDSNSGLRKVIGDRGEHIVLEFERRRLRDAKRADLARKVDHIAARDDSQGFDILSFDEDVTPRPIEVKSTSGKDLGRGFYLTSNERIASQKANYHLYFVFQTMSETPALFVLRKPDFSGARFTLCPTQFHVILNKI